MNEKEIRWSDIMPLEWDQKKYTIGFDHIDAQHRELFEGLNGLIAFLKNTAAADDPKNHGKIIEMLDFLGEYAVNHFRDEEEVFAKHGHPMAEANKEAHEAFVKKYLEYHEKLTKGTLTRALLIQLHIFLQSWLIKHISKVDVALRDCAEKAGEEDRHSHPVEKRGVFSRFLAFFQKE